MSRLNLHSKPVRALIIGAVGTAAVIAGTGVADAATGTVKTSGTALTVRSGPGTGYAKVGTVASGTKVTISCQSQGSSVTGTYGTSTWWDKIGTGRYVSDAYVYTGSDGRVAPLCSVGTTGAIKNDYPYPGASSGVDPWNFYKGQCTSFAAWRVNHNLGIRFSNSYKGQHWGNAINWDNAARAAGISVTGTPRAGDIAVRNYGTYGHVAYVAKVNADGSFVVEEYNFLHKNNYDTRTTHVGKGTNYFDAFIHFR